MREFLQRRLPLIATGAVVVGLAGVNIAKHVAPSTSVALGVGATAALLVAARASGLSWADLGLDRDRLWHGLLWGGGAILAVGTVYAGGLLLPVTRELFVDARYQVEAAEALRTAFVAIPLGTVLLEEVAFRSVLWGMLERHMSTNKALLTSSALFGLWHILPSLDFAAARGVGADAPSPATALVVLGTVAFTTAGGVVAGELRRRSGHVLASAGMHWATNALGVLGGLVAWRIVSGG